MRGAEDPVLARLALLDRHHHVGEAPEPEEDVALVAPVHHHLLEPALRRVVEAREVVGPDVGDVPAVLGDQSEVDDGAPFPPGLLEDRRKERRAGRARSTGSASAISSSCRIVSSRKSSTVALRFLTIASRTFRVRLSGWPGLRKCRRSRSRRRGRDRRPGGREDLPAEAPVGVGSRLSHSPPRP